MPQETPDDPFLSLVLMQSSHFWPFLAVYTSIVIMLGRLGEREREGETERQGERKREIFYDSPILGLPEFALLFQGRGFLWIS